MDNQEQNVSNQISPQKHGGLFITTYLLATIAVALKMFPMLLWMVFSDSVLLWGRIANIHSNLHFTNGMLYIYLEELLVLIGVTLSFWGIWHFKKWGVLLFPLLILIDSFRIIFVVGFKSSPYGFQLLPFIASNVETIVIIIVCVPLYAAIITKWDLFE